MAALHSIQAGGTRPIFTPGNPDAPDYSARSSTTIGQIIAEAENADDVKLTNPPSPRVVGSVGGCAVNDWYFDKYFVAPSPIDFGIVTRDISLTVEVLSTYRTPQQLTALDLTGVDSGLSTTASFPLDFSFLQSLQFDIDLVGAGAPSFSADSVFTFTNGTVSVLTTGQRSFLIYWQPEAGVVEQLQWKTDIMRQIRAGTEQRFSILTTPRQRVRMNFLQDDLAEAGKLRNALFVNQPLLAAVPLWWDARRITADSSGVTVSCDSPANADFSVGGSALIFDPSTGVGVDRNISAIGTNSITFETAVTAPLNGFVVPLRFGYIDRNPQFTDPKVGFKGTTLEFILTETNDVAFTDLSGGEFTTHPVDGLAVLDDKDIIDGTTIASNQSFNAQKLDSGFGARQDFPLEPIAQVVRPRGAKLDSVEEVWKWRQLLGYLRGSWRIFYLPTFQDDFPIDTTYDLAAASVVVKSTNYATTLGVDTPHRDVLIRVIADGRTYPRRITTVLDNGDGTETLTFNSAPEGSTEVLNADEIMISFMRLVRIEGDSATFRHERPGEARLTFLTKGVKD